MYLLNDCPKCGARMGQNCTRRTIGGKMPRKTSHVERNDKIYPELHGPGRLLKKSQSA